jgi:Lon protease-like protein
VEYLVDEPAEIDASQQARMTALFEQCHAILFGRAWVDDEPTNSATLAYRIAARLPMELQQKQSLLGMPREQKRRESLLGWHIAFVPKVVEQEKGRQRAGGNGHTRV